MTPLFITSSRSKLWTYQAWQKFCTKKIILNGKPISSHTVKQMWGEKKISEVKQGLWNFLLCTFSEKNYLRRHFNKLIRESRKKTGETRNSGTKARKGLKESQPDSQKEEVKDNVLQLELDIRGLWDKNFKNKNRCHWASWIHDNMKVLKRWT